MDDDDVEVMGVDFVFTHYCVMLRHIGSTALEGMVYLDSRFIFNLDSST